MSVIDVAERKGRYRAASFYFLSAMSLMTLWWSMARPDSDFLRGILMGVDRRSTRDLQLLWAKCLSSLAKACSKGGFRATPICTVSVSPCCAQSMS